MGPIGLYNSCSIKYFLNRNGYRFHFNGKEGDDEVKGEGNSYDFGARIYDPRLGRWMSVDPFTKRQAFASSYKSLGNNPIIFVDPDGKIEYESITLKDENTGKSITIRKAVSAKVMTDGSLRFQRDDEGSHMIQKYYDFETIVTRVLKKNGEIVETRKIRILPQNGVKEEVELSELGDRKGNGYAKYNFSDLGGLGDVMRGGVTYYSGEGGPSSTKYKSLNDVESVDLEIFLQVAGHLPGVETSKLVEGVNLMKEIIETTKVVSKDIDDIHEYQRRTGPKAVCSVCPGDTFAAVDSSALHSGKITVLPTKKTK